MIEPQTHKIRRSSMNLVIDKWLENSCRVCTSIQKEVECGREHVARCVQAEILTKCRREFLED
jgi:hypothetical protein